MSHIMNERASLSNNEKMLIALLKSKGLYSELYIEYGSDKAIVDKFMEHRIGLTAVLRMVSGQFN